MRQLVLLDALERVPRRSLGTYPTPLVRLENLSRELGRAVYVKRDDALGPACGGNKTRKLEYLLADAIEAGATKIVTVGGPQSNHARLTAAAARMLGLEPHLLLFGSEPKRVVGNLLLDPTYTGKAFAGLLDLHASGYFGDEEPVIFWHTGGLPGLFAERIQ